MTTNTNIAVQLQARLDAVTAGTTDTDMLKLAKAAEGYTVDRTIFDAELQSRITALGVGNTNTELLKVAKTVELPPIATTSITVKQLQLRDGHVAYKNDLVKLDAEGNVYPYGRVAGESTASIPDYIGTYVSWRDKLEELHADKLYAYPADATVTSLPYAPSDASDSTITARNSSIASFTATNASYDNVLHQHTVDVVLNGVSFTLVSQSPTSLDTIDQSTVNVNNGWTYCTNTYNSFTHAGRTYGFINTQWQLTGAGNKYVNTSWLVSVIPNTPGSERTVILCAPTLAYLSSVSYLGYSSSTSGYNTIVYSASKDRIYLPSIMIAPGDSVNPATDGFYCAEGGLILNPNDGTIEHTHAIQDNFTKVRCIIDGDMYIGDWAEATFAGYLWAGYLFHLDMTINANMSNLYKCTSTGFEYVECYTRYYDNSTSVQTRRSLFKIDRSLKTLTRVCVTTTFNAASDDLIAANLYANPVNYHYNYHPVFDSTTNYLYLPESRVSIGQTYGAVGYDLTGGTVNKFVAVGNIAKAQASKVDTNIVGNVLTHTSTIDGVAQTLVYDYSVDPQWNSSDGTLIAHTSYTTITFSNAWSDPLSDTYLYCFGYIKGRFSGSTVNYQYRHKQVIFRYKVGVVDSVEVYKEGPVNHDTSTPPIGTVFSCGALWRSNDAVVEYHHDKDANSRGIIDVLASDQFMASGIYPIKEDTFYDITTDTMSTVAPAKVNITEASGVLALRWKYSPFSHPSNRHFFNTPDATQGNMYTIGITSPDTGVSAATSNYALKGLAHHALFPIGQDDTNWYFGGVLHNPTREDIVICNKTTFAFTRRTMDIEYNTASTDKANWYYYAPYNDPSSATNGVGYISTAGQYSSGGSVLLGLVGKYVVYCNGQYSGDSINGYSYALNVLDLATGKWLGVVTNPWRNNDIQTAYNAFTAQDNASVDGRTINGFDMLLHIEANLKAYAFTDVIGKVVSNSAADGSVMVAIEDAGSDVTNVSATDITTSYVVSDGKAYPISTGALPFGATRVVSTQVVVLTLPTSVNGYLSSTLAVPVTNVSKCLVEVIDFAQSSFDAGVRFDLILNNTALISKRTAVTGAASVRVLVREFE